MEIDQREREEEAATRGQINPGSVVIVMIMTRMYKMWHCKE